MTTKGKVYIAGAGPGDAELITVKLQKILATVDVIITDRLVNPAIIKNNAQANTKVLFAGKEGFNEASTPQEEINELIVAEALKGNSVLRLKGGDVAFFSNVLDELQAIVANEISFEIVPGITAAAGASAYTGIPLTARGFAQGVQLVTYNPNSYYTTEKWKYLANCNDTLVFYMSTKNVSDVAELLLRFSKKPTTPLAVIEQATTTHQQIHITTLENCKTDFTNKQFSSPSLVVIGDVVQLHKTFNWFTTAIAGSVFSAIQ